MPFKLFRSRHFEPKFPIIPLKADELEVMSCLESHGSVTEEEPSSNSKTIAQYVLVADNGECRISVGMFKGKARFANYLTEAFNQTDRQRAKKLRWFVEHYGGVDEFDEPTEISFMIWWRNRKRRVLILFGLHLGPVRVIDEDKEFWASCDN